MSFGSEALFTAFDNEGWNSSKSVFSQSAYYLDLDKAPTIEEAYKELPQKTNKDKLYELELENEKLKRIVGILTPSKPIKGKTFP